MEGLLYTRYHPDHTHFHTIGNTSWSNWPLFPGDALHVVDGFDCHVDFVGIDCGGVTRSSRTSQ